MAYLFDAYTLVMVVVLGLAGSLILALFIANQANEYRHVRAVRKIIRNSRQIRDHSHQNGAAKP